MIVLRAEKMGFCAGVRRAVELADKALTQNTEGQVYTFGPLIHNPVALAELAERSLKILDGSHMVDLKNGDTVLIRAHGVPPKTHHALESRGAKILNATCPLVTASQKRAADFVQKGFAVILAGDKNHGETTGIAGYAEEAIGNGATGKFYLIQNSEEARELFSDGDVPQSAVLLSQTTFSIKEFDSISDILRQKINSIQIISTICPATHERQDALVDLCAQVDGVLVIGGKTSANTGRLFATAQKLCPHAALIETASEIPAEFFALERVGLTAGASTPDSVIDRVESRLLNGC